MSDEVPPPPDTVAVLLAAGGGARYAGAEHKLQAQLRGRPVVAWALDAVLAAGFGHVIVIVGAVPLVLADDPRLQVLHHEGWSDGQATSLAVALDAAAALGASAAVVGLGDQPFIPPSAWRSVAAADADVAVATYDGRRANPVRLASRVWPLIARTGDEGARALMRLRPDLVQEVPCDGEPADIDTVEDLERWS